MRQGGWQVFFAGPVLGPLERDLAPVGTSRRQGGQLNLARVQIAGGHQVPRPLKLERVALRKVLSSALQKLPHTLRIGRELDNAQGFRAHVLVMTYVLLVVVQEVQGGQDVAFAQQQNVAFQKRLQITGPSRHKGRPILLGAFAVALSQARQAPMVQHPRVVGLQVVCPIKVQLGSFKTLQLEVNFAELVVKRNFLGLGFGAAQKAGVGIFVIALQQVPLPFEIGELGFLSVRHGGAGQGDHGLATSEGQSDQGDSNEAFDLHERGVPTVEKSPMLASSGEPCQAALAPTMAPSRTACSMRLLPATRALLTRASRTTVPGPRVT